MFTYDPMDKNEFDIILLLCLYITVKASDNFLINAEESTCIQLIKNMWKLGNFNATSTQLVVASSLKRLQTINVQTLQNNLHNQK